jgi:hypothetical protein
MNVIRNRCIKNKLVCLFIIVFLSFVFDCNIPLPTVPTTGRLVSYSDCKDFIKYEDRDYTPPDRDCIFYTFDNENNILNLKHVNAGFNCCPGEIIAYIHIDNNTINIIEKETDPHCRCLCLYDLDYEIKGIKPGEYVISVIEPLIGDDEEKLEFKVNISSTPSGSYCVTRKNYPWESNQTGEKPEGTLVKTTGCKDFNSVNTLSEGTPPDKDCIEYRYDGESILYLKHINAGFNCCPGEIAADIRIDNNNITIKEAETEPRCFCLCLFDLEYEFKNIKPGIYKVQVIEPYINQDDEKLEFEMNILSTPSGKHCVDRKHYPWNSDITVNEPSGRIVEVTGCKEQQNTDAFNGITTAQDCVEYIYDGKNSLHLKHINAGFNCCPGEIIADIHIEDNIITIREAETEGLCDCLCLFDVDYEIINIIPGEYVVRINGLYIHGEFLEFTMNLNSSNRGIYCVERKNYPWGL